MIQSVFLQFMFERPTIVLFSDVLFAWPKKEANSRKAGRTGCGVHRGKSVLGEAVSSLRAADCDLRAVPRRPPVQGQILVIAVYYNFISFNFVPVIPNAFDVSIIVTTVKK